MRARLCWALLLLLATALGAQPAPSFEEPLVARGALSPTMAARLTPVPLTGLAARLFAEAAPLPDGRLGWPMLPAPIRIAGESSPALVLLRLQTEPDAAARAALLAAASDEALAQMVAQAPLDRPRHPDIVPGDSARNVRVLDELLDELITRRGQAYYSELLTGFAARLRVADWLRRRGDRKCVGVYEELLVEWGQRPGWCEPLYRLGLWYSEQGETDEAVATWERGDEYSTDHGAHFLMYAMREAQSGGLVAQADELLAQVLAAGEQAEDVWLQALARVALIQRAEGPTATEQAVAWADEAHRPWRGAVTPAARYIVRLALAGSYLYQGHDFDTSIEGLTRCLAELEAMTPELTAELRGEGLGLAFEDAAHYREHLRLWSRGPIRPATALPRWREGADGDWTTEWRLLLWRPAALEVSCTVPDVRVELEALPSEGGGVGQAIVRLHAMPSANVVAPGEGHLVVTCPAWPGHVLDETVRAPGPAR
ncbi:MAG TPA: hypothetical protein DCZ72_00275 [Armatimonadetes bacterium]|nr:hypothetical protein [Armatimonadota bacterium]